MSKTPGTSGTMPITGAACGIKPSKKAMEVDFEIDFSQAKQFLNQPQTPSTTSLDTSTATKPTSEQGNLPAT